MSDTSKACAEIRCKVSLGMFANERGVRIDLPDGETLAMFVDSTLVHVEREPQPGEEVDGWLDVWIVQEGDGRAVIDLPQPTFTRGARIVVPEGLLRAAA